MAWPLMRGSGGYISRNLLMNPRVPNQIAWVLLALMMRPLDLAHDDRFFKSMFTFSTILLIFLKDPLQYIVRSSA